MVNVTKPVAKKNAQTQSAAEPVARQRRPRNTELNSSKSTTSAIAGVSLANIRKLNCSRESVLQELRRWLSEDEALNYLEAFENETGAQVVRLATPEEAGLDGDFWAVKDGKEQLWYRTDGKWYTKDDVNSSCDSNLDSATDSTASSQSTTATDPNAINASADDTTLNSAEGESGEPAGDTDGGESVGEGAEVAMITTESGNEVALSDIKIVQNPDTNELALFVKESEDDEIPEGFVVIADAAQAALPAGNTCPECGQDPCVCEGAGEEGEELDSSKKKNKLNCKTDTVDEHEMLVTYVEALEDTDNDLLVKEKLFGDADERPLRECLADWDEHEALVALAEAIGDLMLGDEVMQSILGVYDPLGSDESEFGDVNSSLEPSTADTNAPKQQFQVYYEDENGNEIEKPAVITISDNLEGMDLYEAIQEQFEAEYPDCNWTTICDMNDEVKMDSSKQSELNSSVHDNPALKLFVEKIKEAAKQVSTVPTTEGDGSGYKIIIRGMEPAEIEPIAAEFGIQLSGVKPLEDGFAVVVDDDSLNSSEVDPNDESIVDDGAMRYKDYLITGGEKSGGYIAVSPYGKFSPHVYKTIDECKAAIDKDIKFRFPEQ